MTFFRNKWEEDGRLVLPVLLGRAPGGLRGAGAKRWQSKLSAEELFRFPLLLCGLAVSLPSMWQNRQSGLWSGLLCGLCASVPQVGAPPFGRPCVLATQWTRRSLSPSSSWCPPNWYFYCRLWLTARPLPQPKVSWEVSGKVPQHSFRRKCLGEKQRKKKVVSVLLRSSARAMPYMRLTAGPVSSVCKPSTACVQQKHVKLWQLDAKEDFAGRFTWAWARGKNLNWTEKSLSRALPLLWASSSKGLGLHGSPVREPRPGVWFTVTGVGWAAGCKEQHCGGKRGGLCQSRSSIHLL